MQPPIAFTAPPRTWLRGVRQAKTPLEQRYDRAWDLPRLIQMWPADLADTTRAGRERIVQRLKSALRAERQRGVGGHWTYDLTRHGQLLVAYRHEARALAQMRTGRALVPAE